MKQFTLAEGLELFGKKTKQQLERTLTSKGYEWSVEGRGQKAIYTTNEPKNWVDVLGFEPSYKTAVAKILLFLNDFGAVMLSDSELSKELDIAKDTVSKARLELVKAKWIVETKEQRRLAKEEGAYTVEHRIDAEKVELHEVGSYFGRVQNKATDKLVNSESFLASTEQANKEAMKEVISDEGNYSCVVLKQLTKELIEEQIEFLLSI